MPIDPMAVITILKGAIDSATGLKKLIGEGKGKGDLSGHVLELQGKLTEGLAAISTLIQDNHQLNDEIRSFKKQIEDLNEKLKFKETLIFENNVYWSRQGDKTVGPFCPGCWDQNKKPIRFITLYTDSGKFWDCPICKLQISEREDQ